MAKVNRAGEALTETVGDVAYGFVAPDCYAMPKLRRRLTQQGVRRPHVGEYEVAARAGIAALAEAVGDPEEGERQTALIERYYRALPAIDEDEIDEPDLEARAAIVAEQEAARRQELAEVGPLILAIEANLDRHWPPWRELRADAEYWTEISRIEALRLLLATRSSGDGDGETLARDKDGWLTDAAYRAIPDRHLLRLGTFALSLLAPTEDERKN